jgi:tRNA dimethylallyltransferase
VLAGPTASGKSTLALALARALAPGIRIEIVSVDSALVYRGMDIGTAKPTAEERRGVPHHLIDVANPDEDYSVARYVAQADAVIAGIVARGRVPIVAGGTGFYINALVDRWEFPPRPADHDYRRLLAAQAAAEGAEGLHRQLQQLDPATAERLHPNDVKRIIRALEVHHLTGKPLSAFEYRPGAGEQRGPYRPLCYGLTLPREILYERLERRVYVQLEAGLLEEVRRLHEAGYGPELSAMKGITYRQLLGYLRGEYDFQTAIDLMVRDNRRYAKRQYTWFKADPRIRWIDILDAGGAEGAAAQVTAGWRAFLAGE